MTIKSMAEIKAELRQSYRADVCLLLDKVINNEDSTCCTDVLTQPLTDNDVEGLNYLAKAVKNVINKRMHDNSINSEDLYAIGSAYFSIFTYHWFYSPIVEEELDRDAEEYHSRQFPDPYPP